MEYKLLKEYAEMFGTDFPIASIKDTMNAYEVRRAIQECLATGKAYSAAAAPETTETTSTSA